MPLDHYVSQVHLKKFYSPALGNRMYAIRKSDLIAFTVNSREVCRIMDGSTNVYLRENREIEDFLKTIEPNYNAAVDKLIAGAIDEECIYTIAGFVAYVTSCSPTAMRIGSEGLKSIDETTAAMMEAKGLLPPPPPQLGNTTLTELIRDGIVNVTIDPKFPQAFGISAILDCAATFGNFKWEILHNGFDDSPFCTSDFPAAIEETGDPRILNRIVPLAPNLALRIKPNLTLDQCRPDFSFANFGCRSRKIGHKELVKINCLIMRCAEDLVFYRDDRPWVRPFVTKNRHYRIEQYTHKLPTPTGTILLSTQRAVVRTPPPESRRSDSA
jgi:hypothetical protein